VKSLPSKSESTFGNLHPYLAFKEAGLIFQFGKKYAKGPL
jgi:hypothetical protein